jgi:hypothetical protein
LTTGDRATAVAPRFESVHNGGQELNRVARQLQKSVGVELIVGEEAILNLHDGAMTRSPIVPEQVQHVRGANLGQVMPEQNDVWLGDLGEPHGRYAIGGLLDPEARVVQHGGQIESGPPVVVRNQNADPLVSVHRSTSIDVRRQSRPRPCSPKHRRLA